MAGGNIIVTSTVNRVSWSIDNNSYAKAMKKIRSAGQLWNKVGNDIKRVQGQINRISQQADRFRGGAGLGGLGGYGGRTRSGGAGDRLYRQQQARIRAEQQARRVQLRDELRGQRQLAAIRARSIRFNTSLTGLNLTSGQRAAAIQDFARLTRSFHQGAISAGEWNARTSQLLTNLRRQGGLVRRPVDLPVRARITGLDTSLVAGTGGIITLAATAGIGREIMKAGQSAEALEKVLTMVTGSTEKAKEEIAFIFKQSDRLAVDPLNTGMEFAKFMAASQGKISNDDLHNIFVGINEYGLATSASAENMSRTFLALQQMVSKG